MAAVPGERVSRSVVLPLEAVTGTGWGHGWMETWLPAEEAGTKEDVHELVEICWCRGATLEVDAYGAASTGTVATLAQDYDRPYGVRIWSIKPTPALMRAMAWGTN